MAGRRSPRRRPLGGDALRHLRVEGPSMGGGRARAGRAAHHGRSARLRSARHRQGGGTHSLRHARDRTWTRRLGGDRLVRRDPPARRPFLSRPELQEDRDAERDRSLSWWYADEGRRWNLQAELPAATGAVVVRAIERMATQVPELPDEDATDDASARRADALVALCSARVASDPDPDRATVVVRSGGTADAPTSTTSS